MRNTVLISWALLLLLAASASAGLLIEQLETDGQDNENRYTISFAKKELRTDDHQMQVSSITRLAAAEVEYMILIHGNKTYVQNKLSDLLAQAKHSAEDAGGALADEPFDLLGNPGKIKLKKTGKTKQLNGFDCFQIQVFSGAELLEERWVTQEQAFGNLIAFGRQQAQLERSLEVDKSPEVKRILMLCWQEGFTMEKRVFLDEFRRPVELLMQVRTIRLKDFAPEHFALPSSYKQAQLGRKK